MYFTKTPGIIQRLFPEIIWTAESDPMLRLTFDDGPHPESTPRLIETLNQLNLSATFFCTGENAEQYPQLMDDLRNEGHQIGNHGYQHLSGWRLSTKSFVENVTKGQDILKTTLFRPPYGRMTFRQYKTVKKLANIVMWGIMPGDFDEKISSEIVSHNIKTHLIADSIIVLHDKPACLSKTIQVLKRTFTELKPLGV